MLFPHSILEFTEMKFNKHLVGLIQRNSGVDPDSFMTRLAYTLGCFILPKYMIKSFTKDKKFPSVDELPSA